MQDDDTAILMKEGPMTDLDRVQIYIERKMVTADEKQESRIARVYDAMRETGEKQEESMRDLSAQLTAAIGTMDRLSAALDKHTSLEDQWKKHHSEMHDSAVEPRLKSLEESRRFVTNKVLAYVIGGMLLVASMAGGLVWFIRPAAPVAPAAPAQAPAAPAQAPAKP